MNVTVRPELIRWARSRASLPVDELAPKVGTKKHPAPIEEWEASPGPVQIPVRQLEKFAHLTRAPFGMLFLHEVPVEQLPVQDFRRPMNGGQPRPSLNLIETLLETQLRQAWLSEQLEEDGEDPLGFVGSATPNDEPVELAITIRDHLRIGTEARKEASRTADAALWLIARLEESRITVIRKGFAGTATNRSLDRNEFKGFALADSFAPFIFVNGKDWPSSQVFTIAHECVHLWLGRSALPDSDWFSEAADPIERYCNRVAAEILIPRAELEALWQPGQSVAQNVARAGTEFRVSTLAALFRARNADLITEAQLIQARAQFQAEFENSAPESGGGGGNYYNNIGVHLGKRFVREVLRRTLEGKTLYSEAFDLLGTRKTGVLLEMAQRFL